MKKNITEYLQSCHHYTTWLKTDEHPTILHNDNGND